MARFKIISKDGGTIRYEGKPKYVGTYLRPSYLEFSEIASSVPIAWEVGDYVEYSRTGITYRLYSIPQATKNARKGSHGRAFTYSGVQLFAATKELDIALFRDLVSNDNNIHFSTSPDVVTFEDVYGIARRIQECMDDLYPGRWEIRVADFDESEDAEIISKISEAKDFALSGGTCLDALSKIYELWQDVGWIHTHENGKEVITIGYTSKRIDANTSESYLYGKGNGLTAIKKTQINRDEFATRLYVYGSERNLPSRYYNTKGILNADSVDIRNLMLPLDKWGMTDNLPDARKAYLENAEAVARFGVIPKTHYFDSEDAGADIYPSISGMTIGMLRKVLDDMGQTKYYPSESKYPDPSQRIDEVRFCDNPEDDGAINIEPIRHSEHEFAEMSGGAVSSTQFIVENKFLFSEEFTLEEGKACEMVVSPHISGYVEDRGYSSVVVSLRLQDSRYTSSIGNSAVQKAYAKKDGDRWTFDLPEVRFNYAQSPITGFGCNVYITIEGNGASNENSAYVLNAGTVDFSLYPIQSETFVIRLHELGFNIDEMAKIGNGKTISMKTGACAGRSFKIEKSRHKSFYWDITCRRQKDSTLGQIFPNSSYQIQAGDKFVLVDIGMPESYIRVAMERLFSEGEKLLSRASKIQNHYEPSIDAKVMMESGRTLREGMFMEITDEDVVDNTTDYILIDSLSIIEDESSIPTYKVTLKERRKVTYKGTPSATSTTDTQTSVGGSENEEGFATETFVTEQINILKGLWHIDESTGYLVTDHQVHIKKSLLIDGDVASGGEGEDTPAEGTVTRIEVDGTSYDPDSLGVIDLSEAFKNVKVDLSDYYTKYEVNELIDQIKAGDIDLANYYTKEEIDGKGFLTSASLAGYAKTTDVDAVVNRVKLLEDAGYATTDYVSEAISNLNIGQFATKIALAATVEALSTEIGKKANADDVANTYATKTALASFQSDLTALATRVGIAEGNITSLTNGKADKATTLAGYGITNAYTKTEVGNAISTALASYYTITQIDGKIATINDALDNRYTKTEANNLLKKYLLLEAASQTIKGDITIEGNLVITGDVASGGEGGNTSAEGTVTGVTVSGVDYTSVEAGLLDLTDLMANYALKSASTKVSVSPSLASGKSIGVISVDGVGTTLYAPATYAWSEISEKPNALLFGGTSSQFLKADGSVDSTSYLPTSGGVIRGTGAGLLRIVRTDGNPCISFLTDSNLLGRLGFNTNGEPIAIVNNLLTFLLHSGNVGEYAIKVNKNLDIQTSVNEAGYAYISAGWKTTGAAITIGASSDYRMAIHGDYGPSIGTRLQYNYCHGGEWKGWKTIAFTDSDITGNASSATKLQTARTIWGQSFDGTGDVLARSGVGLMSSKGKYYGLSILPVGSPYYGVRTFLTYDEGTTMGSYEIASRTVYGLTISHAGGVAYDFGNIPSNLSYAMLVNIRPNGNIGIGISSPTYKLDVAGTGRFTGAVTMESTLEVRSHTYINGGAYLKGGVEVHGSTPYIDFHFGNVTDDYTSRIIEIASGNLAVHANWLPNTNNARKLGNSDRRWSTIYGVNGDFSNAVTVSGAFTANSGATITGDVTINGNLIVSGDVASGGTGQDTPSGGSEVLGALRLTGYLEGMGENTTQAEMNAIGLTTEVIDNIFNGKYTIIIDDQGNGFSYNTYHSTTKDSGTINLNQGIIGQVGYSFQIKKRTDGYYDIYMIEL